MENFKYREKEVQFWQVSGEVMSQNKFSETHVSSSGGSAYVNQHGGHVTAPTVRSTSVTNHDFWIKTDNGQEKAIQLYNSDIPLRDGQYISVISAGLINKNSGYYSVLVNHNAKKHWFIKNAENLNENLKLEPFNIGKIILRTLLLFIFLIISAENLKDSRGDDILLFAVACPIIYLLDKFLPSLKSKKVLTKEPGDNTVLITLGIFIFSLYVGSQFSQLPNAMGEILVFAIPAAYFVIRCRKINSRKIELEKKLLNHLEALAQQSYKSTNRS